MQPLYSVIKVILRRIKEENDEGGRGQSITVPPFILSCASTLQTSFDICGW